MLIDILFHEFSNHHKIQGPCRQPTRQQVLHCIKVSLFNQLWIVALHSTLVWFTGLEHANLNLDPIVPPWREFIIDFAFVLLAREISFHYIHRALHRPRVYVYIHKMHHKYITPMASSAEYAHPAESTSSQMSCPLRCLYISKMHTSCRS